MSQTSDKVSSIAARLLKVTPAYLIARTAKDSSAEQLAEDIRAVAASALRQDEVKGIRKLIRKFPFPRSFMSSEDRP